ncbi:MAG: hypothetical protein IIC74_05700 [Bacteroidetes bacterium]|nr:hypothetical protein [Bacteroidota bacterium]
MSNGNLTADWPDSSRGSVRSTVGVSSNKWYWEADVDVISQNVFLGMSTSSASLFAQFEENKIWTIMFTDGTTGPDGNSLISGTDEGSFVDFTSLAVRYGAGDYINVAFDADTGSLWFAGNGVWIGGGDPAAGTSPTFRDDLLKDNAMFAKIGSGSDNRSWTVTANFGASAFHDTVPTGFISGLGTL